MKPLSEFATKQLMNMLEIARTVGHYDYCKNRNGRQVSPSYAFGTPDRYTFNQLKEELATREHIPNKAEAKEIRKQQAHTKKNR